MGLLVLSLNGDAGALPAVLKGKKVRCFRDCAASGYLPSDSGDFLDQMGDGGTRAEGAVSRDLLLSISGVF